MDEGRRSRARATTVIGVVGGLAGLVLVGALAASLVIPAVAPPAPPPTVFTGDMPPADRLVPFDEVELAPDGRRVTIRFTGGRAWRPDDPCTHAYAGWARVEAGELRVAIVDVTPAVTGPRALLPVSCSAEGYARSVEVPLDAPFTGWLVIDAAGDRHAIREPPDLVVVPGLPAGWELRESGEPWDRSAVARWVRTWSPQDPAPRGPKGRLELWQGIDGPVGLRGNDVGGSRVDIGGLEGTLYEADDWPELLLAWTLDGDGLALVADRTDFPPDALVELARGIRQP